MVKNARIPMRYPVARIALAAFVALAATSHGQSEFAGAVTASEADWRVEIDRFLEDYGPVSQATPWTRGDIAFEVELAPFTVDMPEYDSEAAEAIAADIWNMLSPRGRAEWAMRKHLSALDRNFFNRWTLPFMGVPAAARAVELERRERNRKLAEQTQRTAEVLERIHPEMAREMRSDLPPIPHEATFTATGGAGRFYPE